MALIEQIPYRGLVAEIAGDIWRNSPRPIPATGILAALAMFAGIVGRAYHVNGKGLSIYALLLAGTGTGKDSMSAAIVRLLEEVRKTVPAANFFGPKPVSAQGLFKALAANPSFVSHHGEFSYVLQQLCSPRADPNSKALLAAFLDAFSKNGPDGKIPTLAYSDSTKNIDVPKGAAFSLLADSTQSEFFKSFEERHVLLGLIPRMTVVEYNGDVPPLNLNRYTDPELVERLATLCAHTLMLNSRNEFQPVLLDEGAQKQFRFAETFHTETLNSKAVSEVEKALWSRRNEKAYRVAALLAVGCNLYGPVIDEEQAEWALNFEYENTLRLISAFEEGEVGEQATSEDVRIKRTIDAIAEYCRKQWAELKSYNVRGDLHEKGIVTYTYIHKKLAATAPFKKQNYQEPTKLIQAALKTLCERGDIVELSPAVLSKEYGFSGKAYMIANPKTFII